MISFEMDISPSEYTEVLQGASYIAFDVVQATQLEIYFTETAETPTATGTKVEAYPSTWDFEAAGLVGGVQRIWVRGQGKIRGVRGEIGI